MIFMRLSVIVVLLAIVITPIWVIVMSIKNPSELLLPINLYKLISKNYSPILSWESYGGMP